MTDDKFFLPWSGQIEKLEKRNITFRDKKEKANARYALQNNSYYALVNGYKDIFCTIDKNGEDDFQGESFINLRDAFDFDKELSAILFKYLLRIEDSIKAIFSYYVGKAYGHKNIDYLEESNYRKGKHVGKATKFERDILLNKLNRSIDTGEAPPLEHYRIDYTYTPSWVLASCISLDTLLYWYKLSDGNIKRKVVKTMIFDYSQYPCTHITDDSENLTLFTNLMMIIKEYRNRAAHGNRIVNHKSKHNIDIRLLQLYSSNRNDLMEVYKQGALRQDIFSLFIAITVMLSKRNTVRRNYLLEIENLFFGLKKSNPYLYKKIISNVNLPDNFVDILRGIIK